MEHPSASRSRNALRASWRPPSGEKQRSECVHSFCSHPLAAERGQKTDRRQEEWDWGCCTTTPNTRSKMLQAPLPIGSCFSSGPPH